MKRAADHDDNVYFRVNHELSRVLHEFDAHADADDDGDADDTAREKVYAGEFGEMAMGFRPGWSHAEIPGIREKPTMPREDGYEDTTEEAMHAKERPYGRAYFDKDLERRRILEANHDYRFVVLLAGAMGKSPIDLYEEEDLERVLRQREADRARTQQELRRSIVPLQEKQRQRAILVQRRQSIVNDQQTFAGARYQDLVTLGSYLVDGRLVQGIGRPNNERYGMTPLALLQLDLRILVGAAAAPAPLPTQREREAREQAVSQAHCDGCKGEAGDKQRAAVAFPNGAHEQHRASFVALSLFRYLLDNQAAAWQSAEAVLEANQQVVQQMQTPPGLLASVVDALDRQEEDTALALLPVVQALAPSEQRRAADGDVVDWAMLRGTQTVVMSQLERYFDADTIDNMVDGGLKMQYGETQIKKRDGEIQYADVAWQYVSARDDQDPAAAQALRVLNFYGDHPEPLMSIVRQATPQYDGAVVRRVMRAHFVWQYFTARTALGLALDWHHNDAAHRRQLTAPNGPLLTLLQRCDGLVEDFKELLLFYMHVAMRIRERVPVVLGTAPLFRFPANMTTRGSDYAYEDGAHDQNVARFEELNAQFAAPINPLQFISNAQFRQYYMTGRDPHFQDNAATPPPPQQPPISQRDDDDDDDDLHFEDDAAATQRQPPISQSDGDPYVLSHYPVLRVHALLTRYDKFIDRYRAFLVGQLDQVESALVAIDRIMARIAKEETRDSGARAPPHPFYEQRLSFTGQPINSGIINLKAVAVLFMNKAFNLIRQYCPCLSDIEQEDLQSQSAFDCGLESDYACYVAALIAENQNIFAISYKSLHSQRNTLANTVNTMQRLKRYDKRRRNGGWEFFLAEQPCAHQQPILKKRRQHSSIYVTM